MIVSTLIGRQAAEITLEHLSGKLELNGEDLRLAVRHFPLFDWQLLVRYGANPRDLPSETVFLNRPETLCYWLFRTESCSSRCGHSSW